MDIDEIKKIYRTAVKESYPESLNINWGGLKRRLVKSGIRLRYGTNPSQRAALYIAKGSLWEGVEEVKTGKSGLSQTNVEDVDRSLRILRLFEEPSCAVMKHLIPSGVAVSHKGEPLKDVYIRARDCDSQAAWGGVVAFNCKVNRDTAQEIKRAFIEVVAAPNYERVVVDILKDKKNLRIIRYPHSLLQKLRSHTGQTTETYEFEARTLIDGSILISDPFKTKVRKRRDVTVVTEKTPTERLFQDMIFSWFVSIGVRSNGIVISKDKTTLSIGAGQQDRVTAVKLALEKACDRGHQGELKGSVLASDGFLPFRDSVDAVSTYGIKAIIQPGGSVRDREVIEACNEYKIVMAFTGERTFSHF